MASPSFGGTIQGMTKPDGAEFDPQFADSFLPAAAAVVATVARAAQCSSSPSGQHRAGSDGTPCSWECVERWVAAVCEVRLAALSALPADCAHLV